MDKVQFQLEATLPELKDLYEKGLFTKNEIDQITKRRTAYETSLIRRVTRKEDFFKYAEYEINLESLRRVRWKRLKYNVNPPPPSASSYSIPRRVIYILKRATVKFPQDIAVWLAYVEYASREGMRKIVSKGLTSALQQHPLEPTLYLLLSYHHLHPTSPFPRSSLPSSLPSSSTQPPKTPQSLALEGTSPARTTILLGLRFLPKSHTLWQEYIKLELGWVEALRRRWKVLGIDTGESSGMVGGEGSFGPDGEDARRAILSGELVVQALNSALKGIEGNEEDGMTFRRGLLEMLRVYPSDLRGRCLGVVYVDLEGVAGGKGNLASQARLILMTRGLYDREYDPDQEDAKGIVLSGVDLVEELGTIGKETRRRAKLDDGEFINQAGTWLGERIADFGDSSELRDYLLSVLTSLTSPKLHPSPELLILHLKHLQSTDSSPSTLTKTAKSHYAQHPSNPTLAQIYLDSETQLPDSDTTTLSKTCESVIRAITIPGLSSADKKTVQHCWFTWAAHEEMVNTTSSRDPELIWSEILKLSLKLGDNASIPTLHSALLARYYVSLLQRTPQPPIIASLRRTIQIYRPNPAFFEIAFVVVSAQSREAYNDLTQFYEAWRGVCKDGDDRIDAGMKWSGWLLGHGKAKEGGRVVDVLKREVGGMKGGEELVAEVERRWESLIDMAQAGLVKGVKENVKEQIDALLAAQIEGSDEEEKDTSDGSEVSLGGDEEMESDDNESTSDESDMEINA